MDEVPQPQQAQPQQSQSTPQSAPQQEVPPAPQPSGYNKYAIVATAIILLGLVAAGGYWYWTQTTIQPITGELVSTYNDNNFGYSFKHPESWLVEYEKEGSVRIDIGNADAIVAVVRYSNETEAKQRITEATSIGYESNSLQLDNGDVVDLFIEEELGAYNVLNFIYVKDEIGYEFFIGVPDDRYFAQHLNTFLAVARSFDTFATTTSHSRSYSNTAAVYQITHPTSWEIERETNEGGVNIVTFNTGHPDIEAKILVSPYTQEDEDAIREGSKNLGYTLTEFLLNNGDTATLIEGPGPTKMYFGIMLVKNGKLYEFFTLSPENEYSENRALFEEMALSFNAS